MKLLHFEKKLSLFGAVSVTVGAVIGVGIFAIVGPIGARTGDWMPVAFLLAAVPAFFGTLVAVALGATIPADGGGYAYTQRLLGTRTAAVASLWVVVGALGALVTVAIGVSRYLSPYLPFVPAGALPFVLVGLGYLVNRRGLLASERLQIVMVLQLLSALLMVIVAAWLGGGDVDLSQPAPAGDGGIIMGAVLACFAYNGFNIIGELGDEVKDPRRNIPLTVVAGLGIISFVYIGIGWAVAGSLPTEALREAETPLIDAAARWLPSPLLHYLNLAALTGALTSINAVFLAVPRELAAQASDGLLPQAFGQYDSVRGTFSIGNLAVAALGLCMVATGLDEEAWGLVCVSGLLLANVTFSVGALFLWRRFSDRIDAAPFPIRRWWLIPAAILSAVSSLAFALLALFESIPGALLLLSAAVAGVALARRAR